MEPVKKELWHQTAVSVTQLAIQLMPFTRTHPATAYVGLTNRSTLLIMIVEYFVAAFCKNNCATRGNSGCLACKPGFITAPECCQCEPGREEVNGVCSELLLSLAWY